MNLLQRTTGWLRARMLEEDSGGRRDHDDAHLYELLKWLNHELRTPLTALSAAAEVLETAEPGSDDAMEARAIIARQTAQLTRVVNELPSLYRASRKPLVTEHPT